MTDAIVPIPSATKRNQWFSALKIALMIHLMSSVFWLRANKLFQNDSESLVVGMLAAQKYDLSVSGRGYGLGQLYPVYTTGEYSKYVNETYEAYYHGLLSVPYTFDSYIRQVGLQCWVFYALSAIVPHSLSALRFACCIALAGVISAICLALNRRFGLLFATSFYFVSLNAGWLADFAPNLYWVPASWFLPMLLGLLCVCYPKKRTLLYPLIALALFLKSACGYEYLTSVMLGAVLFPALAWLLSIQSDPAQAKRLFQTTFWITLSCLAGFLAAFFLHALIRGSGDFISGLRDIVQNDAMRRTFGNASAFAAEFTPSLNASISNVLGLYFSPVSNSPTARTMFWLAAIDLSLLSVNGVLRRKLSTADALLLLGGWLVSVSWFILAKAHSYDHTYINPVLWYLGFAQIGVYVAFKQALILIRQLVRYDFLKGLIKRIAEDAYGAL